MTLDILMVCDIVYDMPARNSIKTYIENGYYHLYNRGVEKRITFLDEQDYKVFLSYLKDYLLPKDRKSLMDRLSDPAISPRERESVLKQLRLNNFANELSLIAYCLMPNHFHMLVKQKSANTIDRFMQSISTRDTMYFNHKYKRVGSLYQAVYKAVLVRSDEQLLQVTRYIHKQALKLGNQPCSYSEYVGKRNTEWVKPQEILAYFSKTVPSLSYRAFVEEQNDYLVLKNLLLES